MEVLFILITFATEFTEKYKVKTRFLLFCTKWKLYFKAGI